MILFYSVPIAPLTEARKEGNYINVLKTTYSSVHWFIGMLSGLGPSVNGVWCWMIYFKYRSRLPCLHNMTENIVISGGRP